MMFARFDPNHLPEVIQCGPMKLGKCYVEDVIRIDPFQEIKGYKNDVLIVHGAKDKIVNIKYSKEAYKVYRETSSNRKARIEIIKNGGHGFSREIDKIAKEILNDFMVS